MTKLSGIVVRKEMRRLPFAFETQRDLTARSRTTMVSLVSGYEKKKKKKKNVEYDRVFDSRSFN